MTDNGGRKRFILFLASFFVVAGLVFGAYLLFTNKYGADTQMGNGLSYWDDPSIINGTNNDPLGIALSNPNHILFVNPHSPDWNSPTTPVTAEEIRAKASNPATPAPSLAVLFRWGIVAVESGDTIYLRGGVHYLDDSIKNESTRIYEALLPPVGTTDNPMTITAYPGEKAVVTGMMVAKGWTEHGVINGNMVYKKTFDAFYNGVMQNDTPLSGFNGSAWRVTKDTILPYGSVGEFVADDVATGLPATKVNVNSPTTMYISLPNNGNPDDSENTIRVGRGNLLDTGNSSTSNYVIDGLTITYAETAFKTYPNHSLELRNCVIENIFGQGLQGGSLGTIVHDNSFANIGSTSWDHWQVPCKLDT